jgi:hypothetical protein
MRDGRPVAALFDAAVLPLLTVDTPHAVHVYADMVDVLWNADNAAGATELEDLWNALQLRAGFELLCGFAAQDANDAQPRDDETLRRRHGYVSSLSEISAS